MDIGQGLYQNSEITFFSSHKFHNFLIIYYVYIINSKSKNTCIIRVEILKIFSEHLYYLAKKLDFRHIAILQQTRVQNISYKKRFLIHNFLASFNSYFPAKALILNLLYPPVPFVNISVSSPCYRCFSISPCFKLKYRFLK